jgi:hypothetical protein
MQKVITFTILVKLNQRSYNMFTDGGLQSNFVSLWQSQDNQPNQVKKADDLWDNVI